MNSGWIIPFLQFVTAAGPTRSISWHVGILQTRVKFRVSATFDRDKLNEALFGPSDPEDPALSHLRQCVHDLREHSPYPFCIKLNSDQLIYFDGEAFFSHAPPRFHWGLRQGITFDHPTLKGKELYDSVRFRVGREFIFAPVRFVGPGEDTDLTEALDDFLKMDERYPFFSTTIEFSPGRLTPPFTLSLDGSSRLHPDSEFESESARKLEKVAYLLLTVSRERGDGRAFGTKPVTNLCYWIQDGVLVGTDRFAVPDSTLAFSVFADATGLPKEDTSSSMRGCESRENRLKRLESSVREALRSWPNTFPFRLDERWVRAKEQLAMAAGCGVMGGGAGALLVPSVFALLLVVKPTLLPLYTKYVATVKGAGGTVSGMLSAGFGYDVVKSERPAPPMEFWESAYQELLESWRS